MSAYIVNTLEDISAEGSLRHAIVQVNSGLYDEILFAPEVCGGTIYLNSTLTITAPVVFTGNVKISGASVKTYSDLLLNDVSICDVSTALSLMESPSEFSTSRGSVINASSIGISVSHSNIDTKINELAGSITICNNSTSTLYGIYAYGTVTNVDLDSFIGSISVEGHGTLYGIYIWSNTSTTSTFLMQHFNGTLTVKGQNNNVYGIYGYPDNYSALIPSFKVETFSGTLNVSTGNATASGIYFEATYNRSYSTVEIGDFNGTFNVASQSTAFGIYSDAHNSSYASQITLNNFNGAVNVSGYNAYGFYSYGSGSYADSIISMADFNGAFTVTASNYAYGLYSYSYNNDSLLRFSGMNGKISVSSDYAAVGIYVYSRYSEGSICESVDENGTISDICIAGTIIANGSNSYAVVGNVAKYITVTGIVAAADFSALFAEYDAELLQQQLKHFQTTGTGFNTDELLSYEGYAFKDGTLTSGSSSSDRISFDAGALIIGDVALAGGANTLTIHNTAQVIGNITGQSMNLKFHLATVQDRATVISEYFDFFKYSSNQLSLTLDTDAESGTYILVDAEEVFEISEDTIFNVTVSGNTVEVKLNELTDVENGSILLENNEEGQLTATFSNTFIYVRNNMKNGYISADNNGTLTLSFTEELDPASFLKEYVTITDAQGQIIEITDFEIIGKNLTLNYAPVANNSKISVKLSELIQNIDGEKLDHNRNKIGGETDDGTEISFVSDLVAPELVKLEPENDIAGTLTTFNVYFSSAIDPATLNGNVYLIAPNGSRVNPVYFRNITDSIVEITLPAQTAYGSYQLVFTEGITDKAGNKLVVEDGEYRSCFNITEIDLKVSNVTLSSDSVKPGEMVTVSWEDYNNGGYRLYGEWTDGVYFSADTIWDINDILLGTVSHNGGLEEGEVKTNSLAVSIPGSFGGDYYILVRSDIYMQEKGNKESALAAQNLQAVGITVALPELLVDTPVTGSISKSGEYCVYKLTQNINEALELVLDSNIANTNMEIYVGNGYIPTREKYDSKVQRLTDGKLVLNASDTQRELYIMVYNKSTSSAFDYTLTAQSIPMGITGVTGTIQGNKNGSVFELTGVDFAPDMVVTMTDVSGNKVNADKVIFIDNTKVKVEFAANTLSAGDYTISASHNGETASFDENVTIVQQSGANFNVKFTAPDYVGWKSLTTLYVEYSNTGFDSMDAPLIIVHPHLTDGREGAFLTLDESILTSGFWTSTKPAGFEYSVQMLANGNSPGFLEADSSGNSVYKIPVYYASWQTPWPTITIAIDWGVSYIDSANTSVLDWNEFLADSGKTGKEADLLAANLTASVGTTWGDYVKMLNRNMRYLYENNISTDNVTVADLFNMEYRWATGYITYTPEISINTDNSLSCGDFVFDLTRNYYSNFDSRTSSSSFGNGWTCSWDMYLEIAENGDLTFVDGENNRLFQPNYSKGYNTVANDGSVMKKLNDGCFKLIESDGTYRIFDSKGLLQQATNADGQKIVFEYTNGKLSKIISGSETRTITRNDAGLITAVVNQHGNTVKYSYDNNGNLLSVTDSTGIVTNYTYNAEQLNALSSITTGEDISSFIYDGTGRLTQWTVNGHTYTYDYGTTGMVSVSYDGKQIGSNYYGIDGRLVKTVAPDQITKGKIVCGTLTDNSDNVLAGITVNALAGDKIYTAVTDADGIYVFTGIAADCVTFIVQDAQYKSAQQTESLSGIDITSMSVEKAVNSISGTYNYADDTLAEANIVLTNTATGEYTIVHGYAGKFAVYDLAVGEYSIQITAGNSATYYDSFTVTEESTYQTIGRYDLKVGGNITYTLTTDSALMNIIVQLLDDKGNMVDADVLSQGGTYTFENIAAGNYTLSISSPLGANFNVSKEITVETLKNTETTIVLDDGVAITGALQDANGNALKGINVELSNGETSYFVHTDYNGNYSFENLVAGEYSLSIYGSNAPLKSFVINTGDADIIYNHTTEYIATWSGYLSDAEGMSMTGIVSLYLDGKYLDSVYAADGYFRFDMKKAGNYTIVAESEKGFFSQIESVDIVSGSDEFSEFTQGTYSLTVDAVNAPEGETTYILSLLDDMNNVISYNVSTSAEFTGLIAGRYKLTAYNDNFKAESQFEVNDDSAQQLVFEQFNELKIQLDEVKEALNLLLYDANGKIVDSFYIDESGTYSFKALEASNYKLVAFSDNYSVLQEVTVNTDTEIVALELAECMNNLSGTVTVDGQKTNGVGIYVYDDSGVSIGYGVTDENGNYSINVKQASKYSLEYEYGSASSKLVEVLAGSDNVLMPVALTTNSVATNIFVTPPLQTYSFLDDWGYQLGLGQDNFILFPERNDLRNSLNIIGEQYLTVGNVQHFMSPHFTDDDSCKQAYATFRSAQYAVDQAYFTAEDAWVTVQSDIRDLQKGIILAVTSVPAAIWGGGPLWLTATAACLALGVSGYELYNSLKNTEGIVRSIYDFLTSAVDVASESWLVSFLGWHDSLEDAMNYLTKVVNGLQNNGKTPSSVQSATMAKYTAINTIKNVISAAGVILSFLDIGASFYKAKSSLANLQSYVDQTWSAIKHAEVLHSLLPECPCNDDNKDKQAPPNTPSDKTPVPGGSDISYSVDPNDKTVLEGYGEQGYINGNETLNYKVEFENDPEFATAPARWVRVFDTLAPEYDLDTFVINSICLAGNYISVGDGRDSYNQMHEIIVNSGENILVQISINLDYDTREIFAEFTAIDPETGWMEQDVTTGILFPNDETGCGEGYFTYSIDLLNGLMHGTEIKNKADIYFDFNEVIETPTTVNTIDSINPVLAGFSAMSEDGNLVTFSLNGFDADSGIKGYNIAYSADGEIFNYFTTVSGSTWTCEIDLQTEYFFKAQAIDNVGNVSAWSNAITVIQNIFTMPDNYSEGKFENIALNTTAGTLVISNGNSAFYLPIVSESADIAGLSTGSYQWQSLDNKGNSVASGNLSGHDSGADVFVSNVNGKQDVFFTQISGKWTSSYFAQHVGNPVNNWSGTQEQVTLTGKNKIEDIFVGSSDNNVLILTDDSNGDALFLDDVYTNGITQSRISGIDKILAGEGDDIIDLTSTRYAYVGISMEIYGGLGNDTIWAVSGENKLYGDAGNDSIVGGANNDVIIGGIGNDRLHGGGGNDIFCFGNNWGVDTVEQLQNGEVTLWFENGSADNWNSDTMTYTDGSNRVTVTGVTDVTLMFGDTDILATGAFLDAASEKIFEDKNKGMLA